MKLKNYALSFSVYNVYSILTGEVSLRDVIIFTCARMLQLIFIFYAALIKGQHKVIDF